MKIVQKYVKDMMDKGLIRPSTSPCGSMGGPTKGGGTCVTVMSSGTGITGSCCSCAPSSLLSAELAGSLFAEGASVEDYSPAEPAGTWIPEGTCKGGASPAGDWVTVAAAGSVCF